MEVLYEKCAERIATLAGTNVSVIKTITAYVNLCQNLSSFVYTSRQNEGVVDFANISPLEIAIPVLGFASPAIIIITFFLNICVVYVLACKKFRSPTNAILVTIAVLDLITGCLRLPWYINIYTLSGYKNLPTDDWCYYYYYIYKMAPTVLHMASFWCNVLLAFQRYVGVSQLRRIGCVCQYKGLFVTILGIAFFSIFVHCFQFILFDLKTKTVISNELFNSEGGVSYTNTCAMVNRDFDYNVLVSYPQYYAWVRLMMAQILPCVFLAIFNFLLLRITVQGYKYRRHLVRGNKIAKNRELKTTLRMSVMLVLMTGSTLLAESFVALLLLIEFTKNNSSSHIIHSNTLSKSIVISNFLILVTFPLNFIFYFSMSSRFRRHFTLCFLKRKRRRIVPLLGAPRYVAEQLDDEDDEDEDEEEEPAPVSPMPLNSIHRESSQQKSKDTSKSNKTSSQVM